MKISFVHTICPCLLQCFRVSAGLEGVGEQAVCMEEHWVSMKRQGSQMKWTQARLVCVPAWSAWVHAWVAAECMNVNASFVQAIHGCINNSSVHQQYMDAYNMRMHTIHGCIQYMVWALATTVVCLKTTSMPCTICLSFCSEIQRVYIILLAANGRMCKINIALEACWGAEQHSKPHLCVHHMHRWHSKRKWRATARCSSDNGYGSFPYPNGFYHFSNFLSPAVKKLQHCLHFLIPFLIPMAFIMFQTSWVLPLKSCNIVCIF